MKWNSRRVALVILLGVCLSGAVFAQKKTFRIGLSVLQLSNPFFAALSEAAKEYAKANGAVITVNDPNNDPNAQISAIETFIAANMDAIIITATDRKAIMPSIRKARAAGIVVVGETEKLDEYDGWVATDEHAIGFALGEEAGKFIRDRLGCKAEVGILNYRQLPVLIFREQGIEDGIHKYCPNAVVVARAQAGDPTDGMKNAENFLQAHPNMKVICGINDGGALGAYEAVKAAGLARDDFFVGGIDALPQALAKIKEGGVYRASVTQDVVLKAQMCVEVALRILRKQKYERDNFLPIEAVNVSNVDKFLKK